MNKKITRTITVLASVVLLGGVIVLNARPGTPKIPEPTEKPPVQQMVENNPKELIDDFPKATEPQETNPQVTEPSVKPTEPPVEPTEPPIEPTEPPVEPTEPPVEPTEPPVEPTEPPVEPTEPPVEPTEPPVEPTEPPVEPTEPPVEPTEPPVEPTEPPMERDEPKAIDFTIYNSSGQRVKLSDYFGKPIVLNFWASWCGPCRYEMPDFNRKYLQYYGKVHFLMVNLTGYETLTSAMEFIRQEGYVFPVYYDFTLEGAQVYGVNSFPTTFFIDSEGYVIAKAVGALQASELERGIQMILD